MARRELRHSRAIVTGASSGIGRELSLQLAEAGASVVLVARREERLRELAGEMADRGGRAEVVAGDATDAAVRRRAVEAAVAAFGGLDLLINNAGVGGMGLFQEASPDRLRRIMEINFFALAEMTREALPALRRGNRPVIVNVSSILGRRGVPHCSEYCASKFAVQGFSEALRAELAADGIDVLVVSPGTTETEFLDNLVERKSAPAWPEHQAVPAAEVARRTLEAVRRGRHDIIPYRWGRTMVILGALFPTWLDRIVARYR
jgi:short-subunit dehydrogenase